jgi:hypothetical protein
MMQPQDIDLVETAPGEWSAAGDHPTAAPPEDAEEPARRGPIDDIPSVGTPVEFFTIFACLWFVAWLLRG